MKKDKRQIQLKPERVPRAVSAAILAASLCAFVLAAIPGSRLEGTPILYAIVLCAVFTAVIELASLPNSVLLGSCAAFACAGAALFFVPFGEKSIYTAISTDTDISAARVLTMVLLLCGALCLAVCALNRSFVVRCIAAGGLLAMLLVFGWLRYSLLTLPAILIMTYILIVLCQVCASRISPASDSPREMWFVLFSLITAVIVFSLPYPDTRIQWEKLFTVRHTEQLEQLGERLDIEQIEQTGQPTDEAEGSESGYSEDQSSLGGWVELSSDVQLQVEFSDNVHSDRLTGGIYDRYIGTGWVCQVETVGTGYAPVPEASPSDAPFVSDSDLYGSAHIESDSSTTQKTLFYPPYSNSVLSGGKGKAAVRDGAELTLNQAVIPSHKSYNAYYSILPCDYELTDSERESCLTLPESLPERVRKLALTTVDGCDNDEDKAQELMRVLSDYRYDTHVDPLPDGRDFVDYFLFDSREGYCAYFASAMAVMARCVGIPARYVQGYYIGTSDALTVTVSSDNAHAWAELYIDGRWVIYDPAASPTEDIIGDASANAHESEPPQDDSALEQILLYSYAAIAAAAVIFIAFMPFFRRIPWRIKLKRKYGKNSSYPVIVRCGKLMWVLAACGVRRGESETLTEFGTRIREECDWLDDAMGEKLSHLFVQTGKALYASTNSAKLRTQNLAHAVRRMYIRKFGLAKYLRGHRRAAL